jgi:sterol desaturase/sphingolipid hydroxylase (fatty acid hydroxylase superfamily)
VFPFWDVIFGTFKATPRDGHERMRLGLDEVRGKDAHRPLWLLASVTHDDLGRDPNDARPKASRSTSLP